MSLLASKLYQTLSVLTLVWAAGCQAAPALSTATASPDVVEITSTQSVILLPGVVETATALAAGAQSSPAPVPTTPAAQAASATLAPATAPPSPVPTATPLSQPTQLPPGCQAVHIVAAGEWLGLIAQNYGVAIDAVAYANGIGDTSQLGIGQQLCIPAPGVTVAPPDAARTPTPAPGDGLAILDLAASPNPVERGSVLRLRWTVRASNSVSLWRLTFDPKLGQWSRLEAPAYRGTGSAELTLPIALDTRQPLRFELEASDAAGQTITYQTEPIQLVCYPAFYASAPETESCRHAPITTPAEFQAFEHGYLVWRSDTEEVYVLAQHPDQYLSWMVQVPGGQPADIGPVPAGLLPPGIRFAEVWAAVDAGQLGGTGRLRDVLGWATAPAERFELTVQVNLNRRYAMFDQVFLSWPDGTVVQLYTGGGLPRPGLIGPAWSIFRPPS